MHRSRPPPNRPIECDFICSRELRLHHCSVGESVLNNHVCDIICDSISRTASCGTKFRVHLRERDWPSLVRGRASHCRGQYGGTLNAQAKEVGQDLLELGLIETKAKFIVRTAYKASPVPLPSLYSARSNLHVLHQWRYCTPSERFAHRGPHKALVTFRASSYITAAWWRRLSSYLRTALPEVLDSWIGVANVDEVWGMRNNYI